MIYPVRNFQGYAVAAAVFLWFFSIVAFNANAFLLLIRRTEILGTTMSGACGGIYMIAHTVTELLFILVGTWIFYGLNNNGRGLFDTPAAIVAFSVLTFVTAIFVAVLYFTGLFSDKSE